MKKESRRWFDFAYRFTSGYIKGTIYNARILGGSEKELDSMKDFFGRNF